MRYKNNKGIMGIIMGLIFFGLFSLIAITLVYMFFAMGNDYIMLNVYEVAGQMNYSDKITDEYDGIMTFYQNTNLSFIDNMWFFGYFIISILGFSSAYVSRGTNHFSFFSILTYGLMLLLFIASIFLILIDFWNVNILNGLFLNLAIDLPFFNYYITNFEMIFFIQAVMILIINKFDFDFNTLLNRKKKESESLENEII